MNRVKGMPKVSWNKEILRTEDFICRRCRVQPTCEPDRICEVCKAVGKINAIAAERDFRKDIRPEHGRLKTRFSRLANLFNSFAGAAYKAAHIKKS